MRELTNFAESLGWKFKNQTHNENGSFITFTKDPEALQEKSAIPHLKELFGLG